jgi:two-component system, sensor histidine kinase and response regulator
MNVKVEDMDETVKTFQKKQADAELPDSQPGIDVEAALARIGGNKSLYRKLLIEFGKKYSTVTEEIKNLIGRNDFAAAERAAHTLNGIAGNLSVTVIQEAAQDMETALANKTGDYQHLLSSLDQALQPVLKYIKCWEQIREEKCLRKDIPVELAVVSPILQEMARNLRKFDADAENSLEKLKSYVGSSWFREDIEQLDGYIAVFDFENALKILHKIAGLLNISLEK